MKIGNGWESGAKEQPPTSHFEFNTWYYSHPFSLSLSLCHTLLSWTCHQYPITSHLSKQKLYCYYFVTLFCNYNFCTFATFSQPIYPSAWNELLTNHQTYKAASQGFMWLCLRPFMEHRDIKLYIYCILFLSLLPTDIVNIRLHSDITLFWPNLVLHFLSYVVRTMTFADLWGLEAQDELGKVCLQPEEQTSLWDKYSDRHSNIPL